MKTRRSTCGGREASSRGGGGGALARWLRGRSGVHYNGGGRLKKIRLLLSYLISLKALGFARSPLLLQGS